MSDKAALVVDDTPANRDFVERLLTAAGFKTVAAYGGKQALDLVKDSSDLMLAVVDLQLPDVNGMQLTYELRQQFPNAYIVVATMFDERSLMESVFQKGGDVFLVKPHGFMELYKRLTTMSVDDLRKAGHMVIDQYGPRAFGVAAT